MKDFNGNDWIRLLEGSLDKKEYDALAEALGSEEGRQALSDQMDVVLNRLEAEDCDRLKREERHEVLLRIEQRLRRARWKRRLLYAASVAALFVIGITVTLKSASGPLTAATEEFDEIVVAKGERPLHMVFQDGTHVIVNSGSSLRYPRRFSDSDRRVCLSGEAYFKVSPDAARPFSVDMGNSVINVTGTSFNARSYEGDSVTVVTLDEGSVNLQCGERQLQLKPSQTAVYNHVSGKAEILRRGTAGSRASLWKDNVIAFDKTPMRDVLKAINRWYDVEFDIKDPAVLNHTYTFTSGYVPLDSLLRDLEAISFVEFRHNGDRIEIYSSK